MKNILLMFHIMIVANSSLAAQFGNPEIYNLDINKIKLPFDNIGNFVNNDQNYGAMYDNVNFIFSGGFWISGKIDTTHWANGMFDSERTKDYQPGPVGSDPYDSKHKLYIVKSSDLDFGESWQNWKDAVELGAEFYDGNNDGLYNPIDLNENGVWDSSEDKPNLIGDETIWCVYNDGITENRSYGLPVVGSEIRQTVFAYKTEENNLENAIFVKYEIKNIGWHDWDSVYFTWVMDPDMGDYEDDLSGCDTSIQAGYTYNDGEDTDYGINPPAPYYVLLEGPEVSIPGITFEDINKNNIFDLSIDIPLDTAFIFNGSEINMDTLIGFTNMNLNSITSYLKSDPDLGNPGLLQYLINYQKGGVDRFGKILDPEIGGLVVNMDPDNVNTKYMYSGSPVDSIGWLCTIPSDWREMLNVGPFILKKGEAKNFVFALANGRGIDHLNSITVTKEIVKNIIDAFNSNFQDIPVGVIGGKKQISPTQHVLFQNYPNPFNASTKINYSLAEDGIVKIKIVDILGREIATLVNKYQTKGAYSINFDGGNLPSGVYFYKLSAGDFVETKKMLLLK